MAHDHMTIANFFAFQGLQAAEMEIGKLSRQQRFHIETRQRTAMQHGIRGFL